MTRVLVPLAILEGESVSTGLPTLLATMDVTVLGYHVLPEQTPPDQARLQYEDRATAALTDLVGAFEAAGGSADHRLVFTHDRERTVDRVADEVAADAYAVTGATGSVDRLLVALTGDLVVDRITAFVAELVGDREIGVTLFLATDDEPGGRDSIAAAADSLAERALDIETILAVDEPPLEALVEAATTHDAIVMGERSPSLRSFLLGEEADRVAAEAVGPVLVVREESTDAATTREQGIDADRASQRED
ncbi:universal stress protein [Natrinema altunense]|uniref:Amino acid permease-associated region n=1 Tax=Natrinema altunense (strain JCM 12890 / CGMCC 1.3731 / AJ2) TaxID=1227494 RepID=L9ZBV3_NATA2|nr:universal stress protein [Natrinema altunense]ELY83486.1 amino acid permease-associated region [Natrinema altunense JCM 12890]